MSEIVGIGVVDCTERSLCSFDVSMLSSSRLLYQNHPSYTLLGSSLVRSGTVDWGGQCAADSTAWRRCVLLKNVRRLLKPHGVPLCERLKRPASDEYWLQVTVLA